MYVSLKKSGCISYELCDIMLTFLSFSQQLCNGAAVLPV